MKTKFDPLFYCFSVIVRNSHKFTESDWLYYGGKIEGRNPHGIQAETWQLAMDAFLALADD